jgi:alpha-ketoglutarate-dependent taurine dioxygenase
MSMNMSFVAPIAVASCPPLPVMCQASVPHESLLAAQPRLAAWIEQRLQTHGGVLFRGFTVDGVEDFQQFAAQFGSGLLNYEFGSTPRHAVSKGVYTSTEYPAHRDIPLHNEQAYTRDWPMKIWFYCALAAPVGGETPIADSRQVLRHMPTDIRQAFEQHGLLYVRNYCDAKQGGLDVPWQQVFNTDQPAEVEAFCHAHRIDYEWLEDGMLRTRQHCQAIATHPVTGEQVWFNQAHLFHASALDEEVREVLIESLGGEEFLPRQVYFGNGASIPDEMLMRVRHVLHTHKIVFPWQTGDVLMLDNMLTMHAREPFSGARRVVVAMAEPYGLDAMLAG